MAVFSRYQSAVPPLWHMVFLVSPRFTGGWGSISIRSSSSWNSQTPSPYGWVPTRSARQAWRAWWKIIGSGWPRSWSCSWIWQVTRTQWPGMALSMWRCSSAACPSWNYVRWCFTSSAKKWRAGLCIIWPAASWKNSMMIIMPAQYKLSTPTPSILPSCLWRSTACKITSSCATGGLVEAELFLPLPWVSRNQWIEMFSDVQCILFKWSNIQNPCWLMISSGIILPNILGIKIIQ